jgi:hypothetical protein
MDHQDPILLLESAFKKLHLENPYQEAERVVGMCYFEALQIMVREKDPDQFSELKKRVEEGMSNEEAVSWVRDNILPSEFSVILRKVVEQRVGNLLSGVR